MPIASLRFIRQWQIRSCAALGLRRHAAVLLAAFIISSCPSRPFAGLWSWSSSMLQGRCYGRHIGMPRGCQTEQFACARIDE